MTPLVLLAAVLLNAGIPPLTPSIRGRLEVAVDGRSHEEPAFSAILENTAEWTATGQRRSVVLNPDLEAMLADPGSHRGLLCRITGRLEQREALRRPYEGVEAWFVRDESDVPILVFVDLRNRPTPIRVADRIVIDAWFYKQSEAMKAQDDVVRSYPAFVGALPTRIDATRTSGDLAFIVVAIVGLGAAYLLIRILTRHRTNVRARRAAIAEEADGLDAAPGLPDDPAEALAELRRRSGVGPQD